jgi:thiol:disulfide interchange protein
MGFVALAIAAWVAVYLLSHRGLDAGSQELAAATAIACFVFAIYVFVRRVRRGPQS